MILEPNPVTALQSHEFTIDVEGNAVAPQAGLAFRRHAQLRWTPFFGQSGALYKV